MRRMPKGVRVGSQLSPCKYAVSTFSALNAVAGADVERSPIVVIGATPARMTGGSPLQLV
jgi:TPP-dependent 2-oxoacid decarboxylase